jgi:hypothetical protein
MASSAPHLHGLGTLALDESGLQQVVVQGLHHRHHHPGDPLGLASVGREIDGAEITRIVAHVAMDTPHTESGRETAHDADEARVDMSAGRTCRLRGVSGIPS